MLSNIVYDFQNESDWTLVNCEYNAQGLIIIDRTLPARAEYVTTTRAFDLRSVQFQMTNPHIDQVSYTLKINGVEYYYDGSAWVVSTTVRNLVTDVVPFHLAIKNVSNFTLVIYMTGITGVLPVDFTRIELVSVTLHLRGIEPEQPQMCRVFGYIKSIDNKPIEDVIVIIRVDTDPHFYIEASDRLLLDGLQLKTDVDGMWTTDLMPSSQFEGTAGVYTIEYYYLGQKRTQLDKKNKIRFSVPDTNEENIANLITRL